MQVVATDLPEVLIVEPDVHYDGRGYFVETYHAEKHRALGIADAFVQDNQSQSVRHTVRGLHLQVSRPQAKLIRVIDGEILDVAVDVRRGSPTFGRWTATTLSSENFKQCYIPAGFAHGFAVLSEVARIEYKCSALYDPASEVGIAWNDPQLAVAWSVREPVISDRDRGNPTLAAVMDRLPSFVRTLRT
jgi:dTDP-4-dehydrorhamnose 3,5-epimerase